MKRFYVLFILCFSIFSFSQLKTHASHAAGVQLRYEHLTANDYRIHYTFFRNCDGIPVSSSYIIHGNSACGSNVSITVTLDSSADMSQMCNGYINQCTNAASSNMGVEAYYFHGDVTLPAPCSLWTFSNIPICNRSNSITNLVAGGSAWCYYIEAKLNNADFPDNSSPVYNALPVFLQSTQTCYQHFYASDADGDSLVFEMYTPHSNDSIDVQYINNLSAYQPITYALPADSTRFNSATGDIRFKPNVSQMTVVGVRVNEFRNGSFVGSAERDMEVIFFNVSSHTPTATGINGTTSFTSHICSDSLLNFQILTNDDDGDSVRISWQNLIPGSTMNLSGVNNEIANFSWQPQSSDISPAPYLFTLYVTDSVCPYVYFNSYQYRIYVDSCFVFPSASFSSAQEICGGSCISFTNLSTNASSYQWYFPGSIQDTSTLSDPTGICYFIPGNYDVQLIAGNSSSSDTLLLPDYITVYPSPVAQSITQSGDTLFAIQGAASYQWYYNNTLIAGATDYFYIAQTIGEYRVIATDTNGCESLAIIENVIANTTPFSPDGYRDGEVSRVRLYPNPVIDKITIQNTQVTTAVEISIYNMVGEKILLDVDLESMTVNCSPLKPGIYFLELTTEIKSYRSKFIKE